MVKQLTGPGVSADRAEELKDGERIAREQPLFPGHYWKARKAIKDDGIPKGCVLLLKRIKKVDDHPHAVELAGHPLLHPTTTFRFMVHDFLDRFEPEPDGLEIRRKELADLQAEVTEEQQRLIYVTTDPRALLEELRERPALPAPKDRDHEDKDLPTSKFDFDAGLPGEGFRPSTEIAALANSGRPDLLRRQAENQAIAAKTRADMITRQTTAIATAVGKMTPFYKEMGAVALAQSQDALAIYGKLKSGLASLALYTGEKVELIKVRDGEAASPETKIALFQGVVFMDEESLIRVNEGGAEIGDFESFVDQLKADDALLERLLPVERGIVAMRYCHEAKERKGTDPLVAAALDAENEKVFFIIKSGDRVHIARAEELSDLDRLFPTQSDFDDPFKHRGFRFEGIESERITVKDLEFSEARERFDALVLHYRRVMIFLAGIMDRDRDVFGEVAAIRGKSGLSLLALPLQVEAFQMVSDEEFALGTGRPDFWEWVDQKNALARSGSRVICNWDKLLTTETAPYIVVETGGRHSYSYQRYKPKNDFDVVIARREGEGIIVECPVEGGVRVDREFNASVNLSKFEATSTFAYLVLDAVRPEEIDHYIRRREGRRGYIKYVTILLEAKRIIEADLKHETLLRRYLVDAVQAGGVQLPGAEDGDAVSTVIRQWRAAHRGAPTPALDLAANGREITSMLDQLWVLAGKGRDRAAAAEQVCRVEDRQPLRLSLSGRNRLYLYATSTTSEIEELLGPHQWVTRLTLEELKTKVTVVDRRLVRMAKVDPKETVLREWDGVEKWIDREFFHDLEPAQVSNLRLLGSEAARRAALWLAPRDDVKFDVLLSKVKADTYSRSKRRSISHGSIFFPLFVGRTTRIDQRWNPKEDKYTKTTEHDFYVGGVQVSSVDAIYLQATDDQRKKVRKWFREYYANPDDAVKSLGRDVGYISIVRVRHAPEIVRRGDLDANSFSSGWAGKPGKDMDAGARAFLERVKKAGAYGSADSAEIILRFDDAGAEVYRHLSGR